MSKVLLIDDNVTITALYGATLRNAGHTVEVAHDGEAGLAAVRRFAPDVVILDLAMPKSNGLAVLAGIRSNPGSADTPVIVFSNTYTNERLQQVWDAGASQVLSKASSTPKQIAEAIRASLAGARGSDR
jgi:CheY-like chemotaxis protein